MSRPLYEEHVSGPALAGFLRVCQLWNLDEEARGGLLATAVPLPGKVAGAAEPLSLTLDQVERISYVLRIFRLLQERHGATGWLIEPRGEPIFGGRRPIDVMCLEDIRGLRQVAQFLHGQDEPGPGRATGQGPN